jgi:hypothetical protein
MDETALSRSIDVDGFAILDDVLSHPESESLRLVLAGLKDGHQRAGRTYASRSLLRLPAIRELASSIKIREAVEPILGCSAFAVRALLFDKVPEANWGLAWHQDLSITVRERCDAPGFCAWSVKDGVVHVQPPEQIMARMLAVRVHLDDANSSNGALRVIPGSHIDGRLSPGTIATRISSDSAMSVDAPAGSVLAMRPLLLHASSPSESPEHRRVIHLEYAAEPLPHGLQWHESIGDFLDNAE